MKYEKNFVPQINLYHQTERKEEATKKKYTRQQSRQKERNMKLPASDAIIFDEFPCHSNYVYLISCLVE